MPIQLSGSLVITGSITTTGGITISGSILSASYSDTASFSNNFRVLGNLTASTALVTGTLTAQTLVVQTITASVEYSSGSNVFGNSLANTQTFTGSVFVTGSSVFTGSLSVSGSMQSTNYLSQASSTITGLTNLDFGIIGRGTTNGSALIINDIPGANYAIATGGYNLAFYKHVSGSNFVSVMSINGANATNATASVTISNNLGVGTTTPLQPLQLGQVSVISQDANSMYVGANFGSGTGGNYIKSQYANQIHFDSALGLMNFKVAGSGTANNAISYTTAMAITSGGNVGIGITTPGDLLAVQGTLAKYTTTGIDGVYENALKIGYYNDLRTGGTGNTNRWAGFDISTTAGAASSNVLRLRIFGGGANNNAPVTVVDFRGDQSTGFAGAISKASGTFKIDHPLESKKDTHYLVHSFIEGPRIDLIYRGTATLINGSAIINIDESAGMTEGTFVALNRETQVFTTNETSWDAVKGNIEGNILTITSQNSESTDKISWMVIGERQDKHIKDTDWTDSNGKPILEPLKELENN